VVVGDVATAVGLSAFAFVVGPFVYLGHEKLWDYYGSPNEQLSPCRREIADRFDRVKAGASHPRAARGYGLDSAQSISATATVRSSRCADH
jgi:hypothetical protein